MRPDNPVPDVRIAQWTDIQGLFHDGDSDDGALLLGNGFSTNIWSRFAYSSLLAESELTGQARELFGRGCNFEAVLANLTVAQQISLVVEPNNLRLHSKLGQLADEIRGGLRQAVQQVHPEPSDLCAGLLPMPGMCHTVGLPRNVLDDVKMHLPRYSVVFTTNYDLITYWVVVSAGMADLFPGGDAFDVERAESWRQDSTQPKIFFLHGALHLWRSLSSNAESKLTTNPGVALLDMIRLATADPDHVPLFISEGSSPDKVARIGASPYLSFCARSLAASRAPLTVLGQALDDVDLHIRELIECHPDRPVAIGVWVGDIPDQTNRPDVLRARATMIRGRLPRSRNVTFFDSSDHPLTDPEMNCG
ncbi:DUF4917 family protein [Nakamurella multipartita]|uniref:DUF4917 domain-containing protein n=1 Tax=Nakamurella multipartita (strain ATCC 700099 / DSM 44233 / CIP 104796 / JCM 9543 / NBRC 105858 / Y-104) TaxID=479431 RepID=C8X8J8_NAKMY|nr:DUF4917 family protein [Nakamurella multipartita]ACV79053.1 hypothetical protein Namu_2707 [Nakamurella multipartita DSM 44233]